MLSLQCRCWLVADRHLQCVLTLRTQRALEVLYGAGSKWLLSVVTQFIEEPHLLCYCSTRHKACVKRNSGAFDCVVMRPCICR